MTAPGPVADLADMLAGLAPRCDPRRWRFALIAGEIPSEAFAVIREDEGVTAILPDGEGDFARITLQVHSALDGVGLTAAVAGALAGTGIACNVIAGYHHDHLLVPWDRRDQALDVLRRLSQPG